MRPARQRRLRIPAGVLCATLPWVASAKDVRAGKRGVVGSLPGRAGPRRKAPGLDERRTWPERARRPRLRPSPRQGPQPPSALRAPSVPRAAARSRRKPPLPSRDRQAVRLARRRAEPASRRVGRDRLGARPVAGGLGGVDRPDRAPLAARPRLGGGARVRRGRPRPCRRRGRGRERL